MIWLILFYVGSFMFARALDGCQRGPDKENIATWLWVFIFIGVPVVTVWQSSIS